MSPSRVAKRIDAGLLCGWPLPLDGAGDKNARGSTFVVAGAREMPGAAVLCGTAVLRSGAGKVQIGTGASIALAAGGAVLESLVVALDETESGAIAASNAAAIAERANDGDAFVIGPGMAGETEVAALIEALLPMVRVPVVLDAAGLTCLRDRPELLRSNGGVVMTPHCGEMAALLGVAREEIEREPARYARAAAERFAAVVVLKGPETHVAAPAGELYRNDKGDVGLATAGSGDVLAGIIGGLLARGASPPQAAVWGVAVHARAGARLSNRIGIGFLARELLAEIPVVLSELAR
jgi:ADP-dependent NAD(P)H-hydrate dehydratase